MKKTKLLSLTALTLIGLLGLSSCGSKGEKGDTGATGPAGETGPKGDKGDPGENGEDGKDGATWLTGTSKPADTLGNLGDMYLNTTNGDVYQKEADRWKLKMNIQGEDGEDGKDGHNGSNGSTGPKGDTAWSNTILPVEGGYISANVGSATVGEEVTFTFNPADADSSFVWNIQNNGTVVNSSTGLTTTLTMMEGGFVVGGKVAAIASTNTTNGKLEVSVPTGAAQGETIVAEISEDVSVETIEISGNTNNPVVISGTTKENVEKTTLSLSKESLITNVTDLSINDITIKSDLTTEGKGSLITVNNNNGSLSLNNVNFDIPTTEAQKGVTDSLIKAEVPSISISRVTANFESQNNAVSLLGSQSTPLKELTVEGSNIDGTKGTAIHVQRFEQNAAINIKDSEFNCGTNFMMLAEKDSKNGDAKTKDVDINLENVTVNDNNVNPLLMFNLWENEGVESASYFDINIKDVYHNGTKLTKDNLKTEYEYINDAETTSTVSTLSEEVNLLANEQILTRNTKGGLLAVYNVKWDGANRRYSKKDVSTDDSLYPTVVIDGSTLSKASDFVKLAGTIGEVKKGENIFVNGQYYSEVTYTDDNGVKTVVRGTPVEEITFAGGDGSENNPLEISSLDEWELLRNTNVSNKNLYFELTSNIDLKDSSRIENFVGNIDLNNFTLTVSSAKKTSYGYFGTFTGSVKNGKIMPETNSTLSTLISKLKANSTFENLVLGEEGVAFEGAENDSLLVGFVLENESNEVRFTNVDNYVDYSGPRGSGAYIGAYVNSKNVKVYFKDCDNYGNIQQTYGSIFVGNSNNVVEGMYNFENCKNYGTVRGTFSSNLYISDQAMKDADDKLDQKFIQKYKLTGVENVEGQGQVVVSENITDKVTLSKNEDGTLNIVSTVENAASYKVRLMVDFDWQFLDGTDAGNYKQYDVRDITLEDLTNTGIMVGELDTSKQPIEDPTLPDKLNTISLKYNEETQKYEVYIHDNLFTLNTTDDTKLVINNSTDIKICVEAYDVNGELVGNSTYVSLKTIK